MIQIFTITAPLGAADGDAVSATLQAAMNNLMRLHPTLREAAVRSSEGLLTMTLRVSARDRWATSRAARKIASSMLRRVGIPAAGAVLQLQLTPAGTHSLTREQGRSGGKVESPVASADPS